MITGKMVKIRAKRYFSGQVLWVFVGKVLEFTDNWIKVEGKGIALHTGEKHAIDIDELIKVMVIPRENVAYIRILPDDFDVTGLKIEKRGLNHYIKVEGGPDARLAGVEKAE